MSTEHCSKIGVRNDNSMGTRVRAAQAWSAGLSERSPAIRLVESRMARSEERMQNRMNECRQEERRWRRDGQGLAEE